MTSGKTKERRRKKRRMNSGGKRKKKKEQPTHLVEEISDEEDVYVETMYHID